MASRLVNCPPSQTQRLAVNAIIARQDSLIAHLRRYQEEDERERKRLAENGAVLQRSARSVNTFHDIGTGIRDQLSPVLITLDQLLLSQKADHAALSSILPSTKALLTDWTAVKHALAALLSTLQTPMKEVEQFVVSITGEFDNTEMLKDQITDATESVSDMIQCGLKSIKSKKVGILHPLRCLPDEIMLQIFWESIKEERDGLRQMFPLTKTPRLPSTLAGVCKRWRNIVLHTPRFWNYICAPSSSWDKPWLDGWDKIVSLAKSTSLEMTIPPQSQITAEAGALLFHRLNITNIGERDLSFLPSPLHLWIGHEDSAPLTWTIPAALISRTTHIVCSNVLPVFSGENRTVETVVVSGIDSRPLIGSMMKRLRHLRHLDMTQLRLRPLNTNFHSNLSHEHLSSLAIHSSALTLIELYLDRGLRLPSLRHLTLDGLDNRTYSSPNFPDISLYFKETVATLEISGTSHSGPIQSWIETLAPLQAIVAYRKDATLPVLEALHEASDSKLTPVVRSSSKGVTSIILREYPGHGTEVLQILRDIRQNSAVRSKPIEIVLDDCLNILPEIRAELNGAPFISGGTTKSNDTGCDKIEG